MNTTWAGWLAVIERRIVERRDSTSCLVLIEATLPMFLLVFGMQCLATQFDAGRGLYRSSWMGPSLWVQGLLILWQMAMGVLAWRKRHVQTPLPWLVQLTVLPGGVGIMLLALSYGIKDTPMGSVLIASSSDVASGSEATIRTQNGWCPYIEAQRQAPMQRDVLPDPRCMTSLNRPPCSTAFSALAMNASCSAVHGEW